MKKSSYMTIEEKNKRANTIFVILCVLVVLAVGYAIRSKNMAEREANYQSSHATLVAKEQTEAPIKQTDMALRVTKTARAKAFLAGTPVAPPYNTSKGNSLSLCAQGCTEPLQGCVIKGNINFDGEKIYHLPSSEFYSQTKIDSAFGERWFCTPREAEANGWRAPRY